MLSLLRTKVLHLKPRALDPFSHGCWFSMSHPGAASEITSSINPYSFTVSYLQKSCGLPLQSAISASKKLKIETSDNPDSVLNLLRTHGLTQTHIRNIIMSRPVLLLADVETKLRPNIELFESLGFTSSNVANLLSKDPRVLEIDAYNVVEFFRAHGFSREQVKALTMKRPLLYLFNANKNFEPKLEFFKSLGFTDLDIAKLLSTEPYILERSLENQIIPCVQVLMRILGTKEDVIKVIKACYRILELNLENMLEPNILVLMKHGVPESIVLRILMIHPRTLLLRTHRFSEIVDEVVKLGFNPNNLLFVLAVRALGLASKKLWEEKVEAYRNFGLSKDEIYLAFKLQPMCMSASVKKIKKLLDFYVNKLNVKPSAISRNPNVLLFSLEKRIIPRCSVLQLLVSAGLVEKEFSILPVLKLSGKSFEERWVRKYQQVLPDVVKAHQGKIEFQEFLILMHCSDKDVIES
ncbi:hypothetical protein FEM48_Zijuj05G0052800 [Ziziphus jujuba var. spinosa]|uniref:Uncharacterized protein n=1 Tax=Ziziphus jujuba var. spinosa TaxID=714518 RepID=A0A978VD13_ZIZJJ|nr:transcription termination factor MTEF1, chloroplastic-like [Ziziphus jujuba var. spinosa]KAH7528252.1 hypothetical protein FEM48_Zijuj05G0052800 [Ziziphus jujuba var. spinosa]